MRLAISRRGFFWGKSKPVPELLTKEMELQIMQYRGKIDFFGENVPKFETYLKLKPGEFEEKVEQTIIEPLRLIPGKCTTEGTARFKKDAVEVNNIPAKNFRRPYPLPFLGGREDSLDLSTVGLGTYLGAPNDVDDFDQYIAAKHLLLSKTVNVIDTAINYRCMKAERIIGQVLNQLINQSGELQRDEVFISTKAGYVADDGDNGIPASVLIEELIEQELITEKDVAGGIHCMHPNFLEHQLQASKKHLGLETIDLVYLQNAFEQQAHYCTQEEFFEKLAKAFEFYESKRQSNEIQFYGMATWLCFRAKPDEENIYLNFQKCQQLAEQIGGRDHGFRFTQVPIGVMTPEAFVEPWQEYDGTGLTGASAALMPQDDLKPDLKILVSICNLLKMNIFASKPLLGGQCTEVDIPSLSHMSNPASRHLQLVRSMPPRCLISTMTGMKTLQNVKANYTQVLTQEPLTRDEFLKAMNLQPAGGRGDCGTGKGCGN